MWPGYSVSQYKLEKLNEFKIYSLSPVELVDFHPKKGVYLGYTNKFSKGFEITIVKENGEIVISKGMKGDAPNQYSSTANCLGFSDQGDIWLLTPHQLMLYDKKLTLKEKIPYKSNNQIYIYGAVIPFYYFYKNENRSEFLFISTPSGSRKYAGISNFKSTSLIEIYNKKTNKSYEIAPVSERPQYEYLDKSISGIYYPIYTVNKND